MNPTLRAAVAHLAVDDVHDPRLDAGARHHLVRVLRARQGELVTVTDGAGHWRPCRVVGDAIAPDGEVRFVPADSPVLTVAVAVPKAERPEWLVRKVTEIGIDRLVWIDCRRSTVRWDGAKEQKVLGRMRTIAVDASLQSRRVWFPSIEGPVAAVDVLPAAAAAAEPGGRELSPDDAVVAIGPEGGWDPAELALAASTVDLGPTILRVETAALVVAAHMVRLRPVMRIVADRARSS